MELIRDVCFGNGTRYGVWTAGGFQGLICYRLFDAGERIGDVRLLCFLGVGMGSGVQVGLGEVGYEGVGTGLLLEFSLACFCV